MTIFWKRPLTAVALGALFVGAISCGKDGKDGAFNAAGGGGVSCTTTSNSDGSLATINCGFGTLNVGKGNVDVCLTKKIFDASTATGLTSPSGQPTFSVTNFKVIANDGTPYDVAGSLFVREDKTANCFKIRRTDETVMYQVTSDTGSKHLIPISGKLYADHASVPVTLLDSDDAVTTHLINLLSNNRFGAYKSISELAISGEVATIESVYASFAKDRATSATSWALLTSPYFLTYLNATPGLFVASKATGSVSLARSILFGLPTREATTSGSALGAGVGAGTWGAPVGTAAATLTAIGDTSSTFTAGIATGTGTCMLTNFSGQSIITGSYLIYKVGGTLISATSSASTNCYNYPASSGAAGGIVADVAGTAPISSRGAYFIRYRDIDNAVDLSAGVFGTYLASVAANTAAVNTTADDFIEIVLPVSTLISADTATYPTTIVNDYPTSNTNNFVVNASTKWFTAYAGTAGDAVYGFASCTDGLNQQQFTAAGTTVTLKNTVASPVAAAYASAIQRAHMQMLVVKADYTGGLTSYKQLKEFVQGQMSLNGKILDVVLDNLAWPTTAALQNQKLAELAVKSGVFCSNGVNQVSMFGAAMSTVAGTSGVNTPTANQDYVIGHNRSYLPNIGVCTGDANTKITVAVTPGTDSTSSAVTYTGAGDARGCAVFLDVGVIVGDTITVTEYAGSGNGSTSTVIGTIKY